MPGLVRLISQEPLYISQYSGTALVQIWYKLDFDSFSLLEGVYYDLRCILPLPLCQEESVKTSHRGTSNNREMFQI